MAHVFSYGEHQISVWLRQISKRPQRWNWSYSIDTMGVVRNMDEWAPSSAVALQEAVAHAEGHIRMAETDLRA